MKAQQSDVCICALFIRKIQPKMRLNPALFFFYHTETEVFIFYAIYSLMHFTNTNLGVPQFVLGMVYIQGAQKLLWSFFIIDELSLRDSTRIQNAVS